MFLMAAIMFAYYAFFAPKPSREEKAAEEPATGETAAPAPAAVEPAPATAEPAPATAEPAPPALRPAETPAPVRTGARAVVTTPLYTATFEDAGLAGLELAAYPPDEDQLLLTRLAEAPAPPYQPLVPGAENARWEVDRTKLQLRAGDRGKLTFRLREGEATLAQAEYTFGGDDYEVAAHVVAGEEESPVTLSLGSFASGPDDPREVKDISVEALIGTKKKRDKLSGKDEVKVYPGDVPWAALRSQYFTGTIRSTSARSATTASRSSASASSGRSTSAGRSSASSPR
jgi:YidC/Oxa1 family membrane protein insertase